jgi:hypothetical protein
MENNSSLRSQNWIILWKIWEHLCSLSMLMHLSQKKVFKLSLEVQLTHHGKDVKGNNQRMHKWMFNEAQQRE